MLTVDLINRRLSLDKVMGGPVRDLVLVVLIPVDQVVLVDLEIKLRIKWVDPVVEDNKAVLAVDSVVPAAEVLAVPEVECVEVQAAVDSVDREAEVSAKATRNIIWAAPMEDMEVRVVDLVDLAEEVLAVPEVECVEAQAAVDLVALVVEARVVPAVEDNTVTLVAVEDKQFLFSILNQYDFGGRETVETGYGAC